MHHHCHRLILTTNRGHRTELIQSARSPESLGIHIGWKSQEVLMNSMTEATVTAEGFHCFSPLAVHFTKKALFESVRRQSANLQSIQVIFVEALGGPPMEQIPSLMRDTVSDDSIRFQIEVVVLCLARDHKPSLVPLRHIVVSSRLLIGWHFQANAICYPLRYPDVFSSS